MKYIPERTINQREITGNASQLRLESNNLREITGNASKLRLESNNPSMCQVQSDNYSDINRRGT